MVEQVTMGTSQVRRDLREQHHGPGFRAFGAGVAHGVNLDPFINVDVFHMSEPTFPPHPHAGFSAVTYLFPESEGAFVNRDSAGTHCPIGPGALHWTQAGRGIIHEEVPERRGTDCWGVQMFVDLAPADELSAPRAFHLDAEEVPVVARHGLVVRVLAGAWGGATSPLRELATPVTLLDAAVDRDAELSLAIAPGERWWALVVGGELHAADGTLGSRDLWISGGDASRITLRGVAGRSRVLIGGGRSIGGPKHWSGPLAMHSHERLEDARRRYAAGGMGRLAPSF